MLDTTAHPDWLQQAEYISLNAINVISMPFIASSDVLLQNQEDDDPLLDAPVNIETVQVLQIKTSKFLSNELINFAELPQAVSILPLADNPPIVDDLILIDVKVVAVHDSNKVPSQFDIGADATVTNLLIYLHDYKPYGRKFKWHVLSG